MKDRTDLLFESFWKSNRIALLWAAPVGAAAALFAGAVVDNVLGDKWRFAVSLLAIYGVNAALNQIGFNWTAYYRAIGRTRPIAVASVVGLAAVLCIAVPLLGTHGLTAFGIGMAAATVAGLAVRLYYVKQLFPQFAIAQHVLRGLGPTLIATAAVLALRALVPGGGSLGRAALEAILYVAVVVAATALSERRLVLEVLSYVRPSPARKAPGTVAT